MLKHERNYLFAPLLRLFILIRQYDRFQDNNIKALIVGAILDCLSAGASQEQIDRIIASDQKSNFLDLINWGL